MRNVFLVIKHEILSMLGKRSFWTTTFLLPALVLIINIGMQGATKSIVESVEAESRARAAQQSVGYIDAAGLIEEMPPDVSPDALAAFSNESEAQTALADGTIALYCTIPEDFIERGELLVVDDTFSLAESHELATLEYVINFNLVGDAQRARLVDNSTPRLQVTSLAPEEPGGPRDESLAYFVPYAAMMIFFFVFSMSSGFMLRSVSREKENRTVEVLLLSLRPRELMLGKLVGLGAMALLQIGIWLGGGLLLLNQRGGGIGSLSTFQLPAGFLGWALLYFLLGYLLYASAMSAIGALAPSARETGSLTFIVMLPLIIPLWFNMALINNPDGALALVLSLFPLTAPIAMIMRLVSTSVPLWQPIVGVLALAATAYGFVLLSANFFRAETLLSGAALNWRRLVEEFK